MNSSRKLEDMTQANLDLIFLHYDATALLVDYIVIDTASNKPKIKQRAVETLAKWQDATFAHPTDTADENITDTGVDPVPA